MSAEGDDLPRGPWRDKARNIRIIDGALHAELKFLNRGGLFSLKSAFEWVHTNIFFIE